jgi:hypothetical protein
MWLCAFCSSTVFFTYMTMANVKAYLAYEVVTKIQTLDQPNLPFPKVTVCSVNPFVTDAGVKFVASVLQSNNIADVTNSSVLTAAYPMNMSQVSMNYLAALNLAQAAALDPGVNDSTRQSFGLTYEQLFVSCVFAMTECSREYWVWYYDPQYG